MLIVLLLFLKTTTSYAQTQPGDVVLGDWMDANKETVVHCYKENGKYYGKLIWIENIEERGKPISKADEKYINYLVLKDFEYKNNEWADGIIHQPKTNKTYTAYIKLISTDTMEVIGYKYFRFLSESQLFTRVTLKDVQALNLKVALDEIK